MSKTGDDGIPLKGDPGFAPPQSERRPILLGLIAAVVFVVVAGSVYGFVASHHPRQLAGRMPTGSGMPTVTATFTTTPTLSPTPMPDRTATSPDGALALSRSQALNQLQAQADDESEQVANLAGSWVPQVSSKCVGVRVDIGPDWIPDGQAETAQVTIQQILGFHLSLQERFHALTARPTELGIASDLGHSGLCQGRLDWLSIVPESFADPEDANAWCDQYVPPKAECLARLVSPGGGSEHVDRV